MLDPVGAYSAGQVDPSALGQIGYRDSDGDGVPDPLDTAPAMQISIAQPQNQGRPVVSGQAADQPYPSLAENPVTINTITRVEYRVDGGGWVALPAADGAYDSPTEPVTATLPLYDGQHTVDVRAINSAGAASPLISQSVTVRGVGPQPAYAVAAPSLSNSAAIMLTLTAPSGSVAQISEDPLFGAAAWLPAAAPIPWRLSSTDGQHTLYVRFRDGNGVESPSFSRSITLDRTAPTGHALLHGGDRPWLEIQAQDSGSGTVAIQLAEDAVPGTWQRSSPRYQSRRA